jgi:hypothetical protein
MKQVRSDFTGDSVKDVVRHGHISTALGMYLADMRKCKLRCDWLELAGKEAPSASLLFEYDLLEAPYKYIGWDTNVVAIAECRELFADQVAAGLASFHTGDLKEALTIPVQPHLRDVGVLVWDQTGAPTDTFIDDILPALLQFAKEQRKRMVEFLLVIAVSHPPQMGSSKDVQLQKLGEVIGKALGEGPVLPEDFLQYTGEGSVIPMHVLRIRLV